MSEPVTLIIEVQIRASGAEHLALHLREPLELAVLGRIADLTGSERHGVSVTSRITDCDGIEL